MVSISFDRRMGFGASGYTWEERSLGRRSYFVKTVGSSLVLISLSTHVEAEILYD